MLILYQSTPDFCLGRHMFFMCPGNTFKKNMITKKKPWLNNKNCISQQSLHLITDNQQYNHCYFSIKYWRNWWHLSKPVYWKISHFSAKLKCTNKHWNKFLTILILFLCGYLLVGFLFYWPSNAFIFDSFQFQLITRYN